MPRRLRWGFSRESGANLVGRWSGPPELGVPERASPPPQSQRVPGSVSHPALGLFPLFNPLPTHHPQPCSSCRQLSRSVFREVGPVPHPQLCSGLALLLLDPHPASNLPPPRGSSYTQHCPCHPHHPRREPQPLGLAWQDLGPAGLLASCPPHSLQPPDPPHLPCSCTPPSLQLSPSPLVSLGPASLKQRQLCSVSGPLGGKAGGGAGEGESCVFFFCVSVSLASFRAGAHSGLISESPAWRAMKELIDSCSE